jgi:hypothetical protein
MSTARRSFLAFLGGVLPLAGAKTAATAPAPDAELLRLYNAYVGASRTTEEDYTRSCAERVALLASIASLPATTVAGLEAKTRIMAECVERTFHSWPDDPLVRLAASAVQDVAGLARIADGRRA